MHLKSGLIISAIFVLPFLLIIVQADKYELRLNLTTCMPDGLINGYRERINPKEFWISQHVVLDVQLNSRGWEYEHQISICKSQENLIQRQKCEIYYQLHWQSLRKCLAVTKKMCNLNGAC